MGGEKQQFSGNSKLIHPILGVLSPFFWNCRFAPAGSCDLADTERIAADRSSGLNLEVILAKREEIRGLGATFDARCFLTRCPQTTKLFGFPERANLFEALAAQRRKPAWQFFQHLPAWRSRNATWSDRFAG